MDARRGGRGVDTQTAAMTPPARRGSSGDPSPESATAESGAWRHIAKGWTPLFAGFARTGFSIEWHDFVPSERLDWSRSFHPGSVELCLNFEGEARFDDQGTAVDLPPGHYVFYHQDARPLGAVRRAGQRHRFATVEFSVEFLRAQFSGHLPSIHPVVLAAIQGESPKSRVATPARLPTSILQTAESLLHCPAYKPAQGLWFQSKAIEMASQFFFVPGDADLFCTRTQRASKDRVERARAILRERLQDPPSLEELGRLVGCSSYYLSRLFSQGSGVTIQQFVRQCRMERAAELLRSGHCNVTEAALEVGYQSLSHFSSSFHEFFGCCPGLYGIQARRSPAGLG